jgi:hypothetical protein
LLLHPKKLTEQVFKVALEKPKMPFLESRTKKTQEEEKVFLKLPFSLLT